VSNTVVLSAFVSRKTRLAFLAVIFFHLNFLQLSHSEIGLLLSTCASLHCSHAKQIREDPDELEKQVKATLPTGNRKTLPQRDRRQQKNDKSAFGSDALD